ncbi:MAG TPA: EamA family transporter [Intrasporangium sp.]|nr:EamA family transporter [Intrasporangium sp.]
MTVPDTERPAPLAAAGPLSPASATRRQRGAGIAAMLASSASNQAGAALGAMAFSAIGPMGVVAVRQFVTALVLAPVARPRFRSLRRQEWWLVLALAGVFGTMNATLYASIDRIGLGLAVTLEFLGPLAVAIASSRRAVDIACAALAGVGVVVLTDPGPTTDLIGVGLALVAAGCWASYILLNRALGQRLPGIRGTAAASVVSAAAWTPIAVVWFATHLPSLSAVVLAVGCGLLSSAIPYAADLLVLRRVPAQLFGTLTSLNPVWAALAGWALLGQALHAHEWVGVAVIVTSSLVVSTRGLAALPKEPVRQVSREQ